MFDEEPAGENGPDPLADWAVPGVDQPRVDREGVPVVLPAAVSAVQAALDGLRDWRPAELAGEQALACAGVLLAAEQLLVAARLRSLADIEQRRLHTLAGARSTSMWLRQQGGQVPAGQMTLARRLSGLPLLADELAAGRLSVPVAQRVHAALGKLRPHLDRPDGLIDGQPGEQVLAGVIADGISQAVAESRGGYPCEQHPELVDLTGRLQEILTGSAGQLARLEAAFVLLAGHLDPDLLGPALDLLVDSVLPLQLENKNRRGELARAISLVKNYDGSGWRLRGELSLEAGERAHAVLNAELIRDPDNPSDTAAATRLRQQGRDPHDQTHNLPASARPRSRQERMHDALSHAFARYLDADLGGSHNKNPVQILVTVPAPTLDRQPGASPARGASGAHLPVNLVRRWACHSALTRLVMTLTGRAIEISHTERTLKAHERRILHSQTGGVCQETGCTNSTHTPGMIMHPHHANPWATTGTTSLNDTVLLCDTTHTHLHHGNTITLKDGRHLGPNGWNP